MNDDTGSRNASRRRRTTRRLMKHAARALGQVGLEAPDESPPSVESTGTAAVHDGELSSHEDLSTESANEQLSELDMGPPSAAVEESVKWSAEQSPLMAALSAAAEAGGQAWSARNAQDEPDTTLHAALSRPPPVLSEVSTANAFGVSGELLGSRPTVAAEHGDEQKGHQDNAASEGGAPFLVAEQQAAAAAQADVLQPSAADETAKPPLASASYAEEKTQDLDIVADMAALSEFGQSEIADSDRPGAANRADGSESESESEYEAKTRPKIRLPDGALRRLAAKPPTRLPSITDDSESAQIAAIRALSPVPASSNRGASPPPPAPDRRAGRNTPTGEGIIRASQPPRPSVGQAQFRPDLESDVPTRPRIPLTHDMALAAGRVSTLGVQRTPPNDVDQTSPRLWSPGDDRGGPAVVVTRSQVISDHPPALYGKGHGDQNESAAAGGDFDASLDSYVAEDSSESYSNKQASDAEQHSLLARQRRPRPDSEEFEMLDLDGSEEQTSRLEIPVANGEGRDTGVRVSRTPPPPPAQPNAKQRNASAAMQQRAAPPPPPPPGAAKKPAPAKKAQAKRRAWWEVLFSDDYVKTLPRPSQALVAKQVAFMESSLGISRGDAVLDVGCGLGQHALEFARRGYLVVALDLALSMITRAAEEAQQNGLRINFLHKDIRDIGFEGTFDAIICVGTTFGFFDDEQNRGVLQRLAHALKPGGRLLLEVVNRDYVIGSQPNLVWFEGDGCVVMEESDFNFYSSRLNVKRTMMREDGRQTESEYSVRLYSVHELGQLLKQAGFGIKEVSGQEATRGLFFGAQSSRIIMLAERRSAGRTRPESQPPESE